MPWDVKPFWVFVLDVGCGKISSAEFFALASLGDVTGCALARGGPDGVDAVRTSCGDSRVPSEMSSEMSSVEAGHAV